MLIILIVSSLPIAPVMSRARLAIAHAAAITYTKPSWKQSFRLSASGQQQQQQQHPMRPSAYIRRLIRPFIPNAIRGARHIPIGTFHQRSVRTSDLHEIPIAHNRSLIDMPMLMIALAFVLRVHVKVRGDFSALTDHASSSCSE